MERQVGKLRQGLARLIDSYAEGLIEKQEFEPRVTRLRQRITHVEAQCQQLAEAETLQRELQLIIGRVEEFAAQVQQNLVGPGMASPTRDSARPRPAGRDWL